MATTLHGLKTYYSNIMRADFAHIPGAHQTLLTNLSAQVDAGSLGLTAAQRAVAALAIDTTSVATIAYNFFTGAVPREGGLDYLVSPTGLNPNNLNSAYYQSASLENRYINFAVNLGKLGEGSTRFAAGYGDLTLAQTTAKAYLEIFGTVADAAKVSAILDTQVPNGVGGTYTRADYFAFYGRDGLNGAGTKAALVGWLMAEAVKADTGVYAQANNAFLADLGADGVARFQTNLAAAYGPPPPAGAAGATISFAADQSVGPANTTPSLQSTANNDTITGSAGLNAGQTVNGGAGNDSYTISGTINGRIEDSGGNNKLTLGAIGTTGSVVLGPGVNDVTLTGGMEPGTSITAAQGSGSTIHLRGTTAYSGQITGFQTIYLDGPAPANVSGAAVVYDMVPSNFAADTVVGIAAYEHQTVVLKDTSYAVQILDTSAEGKANVDVHLDHFTGAPTTAISSGLSGIARPNGGAITVQKSFTSTSGPSGRVTLHVDSDSTAGYVSGFLSQPGRTLQPPFETTPVLDLKIVGAGSLTAQLGFANVDARDAADLNLSWDVFSGGQTLRLGDGTNTLKLFFAPKGQYLRSISPPSFAEIYLGAGVDTLVLRSSTFLPGESLSYDTLSNIHIAGGGSGAVTPPPAIFGFQKGVDKLVLDAQVHAVITNFQQLAEPHATLTEALRAISPLTPARTAAVFTYRGDTYVYAQDQVVGLNMGDGGLGGSAGDGLIKLAGVTGLTVGTGAGAFDIHYG